MKGRRENIGDGRGRFKKGCCKWLRGVWMNRDRMRGKEGGKGKMIKRKKKMREGKRQV